MIKTIFVRLTHHSTALLFLIFFLSAFQPDPKVIILHDEQLSIIPKEYYVANVVDERDNRSAIAWLLPVAGQANAQPKAYPVDFQGGGLSAIKLFIEHNLPRNPALRPIVIRLKKFAANESPLAGGRVEGHVAMAMSFDLKRDNEETVHLADYNGSAKYNRKAGTGQAIEPILRHVLEDGLAYLNTWMDQQASTNINLARSVRISFTDYREKKEGDSIYYSIKRPLTWDDFRAAVPTSKFDAEAFPGLGYEERAGVAMGVINVQIAVKVYLPKSAGWVKSSSRTAYALNHEQRHFDIVKIVAEHFKKNLTAEHLPVGNFEGPINVQYLESLREMNRLQKEYDGETKHGSDQTAQQSWNERIDKELKELGVKGEK